MDFFDAGSLVRLTQIFMDSAGTAIDPSVVKFQYLASALGVTTTYTYGVSGITKAGTGTYYVSIDTNESAGQYNWKFYSTGTGQASDIGTFYVRPDATTLSAGIAANTVTFPLSVLNGGTGLTTVPANDLLYGNGTSQFNLVGTANNAVLVTGPTGIPSLNVASANLTVTNSALNTAQDIQTVSAPQFARLGLGVAADLAAALLLSGYGGIGAVSNHYQWNIGGSWSGQDSLSIISTNSPPAGDAAMGLSIAQTINKAGSGTHDSFNGAQISAPIVGAGAATLTRVATLSLLGTPAGGANNYIVFASGSGAIEWSGTSTMSLGGVYSATTQLALKGTYAGANIGTALTTRLQPVANALAIGLDIAPTFDIAGSGTHASFDGVLVEVPAITAGTGALTAAASLRIAGPPTGATTNYSLKIDSGKVVIGQGPHAIGGAVNTGTQLYILGTFAGIGACRGLRLDTTFSMPTSTNGQAMLVNPTFATFSSGTHTTIASIEADLAFTDGGATITNAVGVNIPTFAAPGTTTTATGLRVAVPTGAGTNRAVDVLSGTVNIATGGSTTISTGVGSVRMSTANAATNSTWIPFSYAGTTIYVPGWTTFAP